MVKFIVRALDTFILESKISGKVKFMNRDRECYLLIMQPQFNCPGIAPELLEVV